MNYGLIFLSLVALANGIPLSNEFPFVWETKCTDLCACDDKNYQINCQSNGKNESFEDISFQATNRAFKKLFFTNYPVIPSGAFKDLAVSNNSLYINIVSTQKIHANAFNPLGNLTDSADDYDFNLDLITPLVLDLEDFAFNNLKINQLNIFDIKTSSEDVYLFNLGSLLGAKTIRSFALKNGNSIADFSYDSSLINNERVVIESIETQEIKLKKFTNRTLGNKVIDIEQLKSLTWITSGLESIENYAFNEMKSLTELILSNNKLKEINTFNLYQLDSSLLKLDLSSNPIEKITQPAFDRLTKLKHLSLYRTDLDLILENQFDNLSSLEVLNLSFLTKLIKFNWKSLINLKQLKEVSLSYMNSKSVVIDDNLIEENANLIASVINSGLKRLGVYGYNFTDSDACIFASKSIDLTKGFALLELSSGHACNCFAIEAYRNYRLSLGDENRDEFRQGLIWSPSCYRNLYDFNNYQNLSRPNNNIIQRENECRAILSNSCFKETGTTHASTSPTATSIFTTSNSEPLATTINKAQDDNSDSGLLIAVIVLCCVIIVLLSSVLFLLYLLFKKSKIATANTMEMK